MCSAKPVSAKKTFFGQQIKSVTWHYGNLYSINYTITVIAYNSLRVIVATDDMRGVTDFTWILLAIVPFIFSGKLQLTIQ